MNNKNQLSLILRQTIVYLFLGTVITVIIALAGIRWSNLGSASGITASSSEYPTSSKWYEFSWVEPIATRTLFALSQREISEIEHAQFARVIDFLSQDGNESINPDDPNDHSIPKALKLYNERLGYLGDTTVYFGISSVLNAKQRSISDNNVHSNVNTYIGYDRSVGALWTIQITDSYGWPFRCLNSTLLVAPITHAPPYYLAKVYSGLPLVPLDNIWHLKSAGDDQSAWSSWRSIPFGPMWVGLIFDIVFWSGILFIAFTAITTIKHQLRRMKGRCPKCGYLLRIERINGCSECGWRQRTDSRS